MKNKSTVNENIKGFWNWYKRGNFLQKILWIIYFLTVIFAFFYTRTSRYFYPYLISFIPLLLIDSLLGKRK